MMNKKKYLAGLLSVAVLATMMPVAVLAEEPATTPDAPVVTETPAETPAETPVVTEKAEQTIEAANVTVTAGKTAKIGATTTGNGTLSYKSSKTCVATISKKGEIKAKKVGCSIITIKATETAAYKASELKITVYVVPGKIKIASVASNKCGTITVKWPADTKVSGYVICYSQDKTFAKENCQYKYVRTKSTKKATLKDLEKGKTYYVKICTFKKVDGKAYKSAWSKVKKAKVKK